MRYLLLFWSLFVSVYGSSQSYEISYKNPDEVVHITSGLFTFEDSTATIEIGQIHDYDSLFRYHEQGIPNFDNTRSTIWLRFDLSNPDDLDLVLQCANPEIEHLSCYGVVGDSVVWHTETGTAQNYFNRYFRSNKLSVPVNGKDVTVYLQIRSGSALYLPLALGTAKAVASDNHIDDLFNGAVVGIMLLLLVYNFFIFLSVRDTLYLKYCFYLMCSMSMIMALEGLHLDLFPGYYNFLKYSHITNTTVVGVTGAGIWFSTGFLNLRKHAPFTIWINGALLAALAISLVFDYGGNRLMANHIVQAASGLTSVYLLVMGIWLFAKGQKSARFYIISWGVLVTSAVIYILTITGMIGVNFISLNSFQLGSMFEGGLLSFALADRINQYRIEKNKAQKMAIEEARKNEQLIRTQNVRLEELVNERTRELKVAKEKSDDLLLNILPQEIADELKESGHSTARLYENVSVLFTDFVNFTGIADHMTASQLVEEIHHYYKVFDEIMEKYQLEKIKTIGDSYLAVCGLPNANEKHAGQSISAAFEILDFVGEYKKSGGLFDVRIGIHSGPVVAGIVGIKKFAFDIWGDTVNTASRMEGNSLPGKINISQSTYQQVKDVPGLSFESRGKLEVKGKGEMKMYFVGKV